MKPRVSVVVPTRNDGQDIGSCLDALDAQTFRDFEVIVVDDGSSDGTEQAVRSRRDARLRYFRRSGPANIAAARNLGIGHGLGEYVFSTDADCVPTRYWIEEGVRRLDGTTAACVEGKTYYGQPRPTLADRVTQQMEAGHFQTCNIAYRRNALEAVGLFDPAFCGHSDTDLGLRLRRMGGSCFSESMVVCHSPKVYTARTIFEQCRRMDGMVLLIKRHGKSSAPVRWNILCLRRLASLAFPPLAILDHRIARLRDVQLLCLLPVALAFERFVILRAAVKYRVFVI